MDDDIAGEPSYPVGMAYSRAGREMTGQYRRPAQYRTVQEASPVQDGQEMSARLAREVAQRLRYIVVRPGQSASQRHSGTAALSLLAWAWLWLSRCTAVTRCLAVPCGDECHQY